MTFLLLSLLALAMGFLALPLVRTRPRALAALDGFVIATVGGLVLLHLIPHSLAEGGPWALVAGIVGLLLPLGFERGARRWRGLSGLRPWLALGVLAGLLAHAFMDGAALALPDLHEGAALAEAAHAEHGHEEHAPGTLLALSVILHRLPMGLAIAWTLWPRLGAARAAGVVGLVGVATVAGFGLGVESLSGAGAQGLAIFQALVAGALLHVVFGHAPPMAEGVPQRRLRALGALGALLGMGVLGVLTLAHPLVHHHREELSVGATFLALAATCAPALLAGLVGAGLLRSWSAGPRLGAAPWWRAVLAGPGGGPGELAPRHGLWLGAGVGRGRALAGLLLAPALGLDAALVTWSLLGGGWVVARLLGAAALAAGAALLLRGAWRRRGVPAPAMGPTELQEAGEPGGLIDHAVPWTLMGLLLAALLEPMLPPALFASAPLWLSVLVMALVGLPLHLGAGALVPVAVVLLHKGLAPGAALALLLVGPAVGAASLRAVARAHGLLASGSLVAAALALVVGLGLGLEALSPTLGATLALASLHGLADEAPGLLQWASLGALGALALWALVRQGPRGFLLQLAPADGRVAPDHAHGAEAPCEDACADDGPAPAAAGEQPHAA